MGERRAVKTTAVLWCTAVVIVVVGCVPEPAPTPLPLPTATGFASDEEAFAAAEATYRAYVDALNAQYSGRGESEPTAYLVGAALLDELAAEEEFESMDIRVVGSVRIASFEIRSASEKRLDAVVCLDVRDSRVLNGENVDVTPAKRAAIVGLDVQFDRTKSPMLISDSSANESSC